MSDTPAVSLREARQREADAEEVMYYYPTPANRERHAAARRATDEALVRAVTDTRSLREMWRGLGIRHHSDGQTTGRYLAPLHDDHHRQYLGVAMTGLPEAVEQAIHAADETNTRIAEAANGSDLTDLYTEWREALTALRAAILAYGAARERQGIERAAAVCDGRAKDWDENMEGWADPIRCAEAEACRNALRALPVDGATP